MCVEYSGKSRRANKYIEIGACMYCIDVLVEFF